MFHYAGNGKWINESAEWTSDELATLYYSLFKTLETTRDVDVRHDIVFLMEKLFCETDEVNINDAFKK